MLVIVGLAFNFSLVFTEGVIESKNVAKQLMYIFRYSSGFEAWGRTFNSC